MSNCQEHEDKSKNYPANIIGPQIRKIRYVRGWSQSHLALKLQLRGLDVARDAIAHIECQTRCVKDKDIPHFAAVLGVNVSDLFPHLECNRQAA